MGRRLALFFPDVSRAVGFFRAYSREVSLDEVLSSLEILESVSERGGREMMVRFEVQGSYAADRAAQAARLHRGRAFTGTEQHYVPYRDRRSPLGYDLTGPEDLAADALDMVLYGEAGADRRKLGRSIALKDLVLGLTPRPLSQAERDNETHDTLVIRCEQGLSKMLCRYLWSRQVRAKVTSAMSARRSLFSGRPREVQLVRCESIPRHVAQLLSATPGMRVFVPTHKHLMVEWGFRHPIALESCGAAFPTEETILFYGSGRVAPRSSTTMSSVASLIVAVAMRPSASSSKKAKSTSPTSSTSPSAAKTASSRLPRTRPSWASNPSTSN